METIQPEEREALLAQLAKPRRRAYQPPKARIEAVVEVLRSMAAEAPTPWWRKPRPLHKANCRHYGYHLTCAEFLMLEQESGGFCDICGRDMQVRPSMIEIDHDHAIGRRAVRGLLCAPCNVQLGVVEAGKRRPSRAMRYYLDNPWHARVGLEPLTCPAECAVAAHRGG